MSQELESNALDLVKQKGFYHYEYTTDFEKFEKKFPRKEKFPSSLTGREIGDKDYEHAVKAWNAFEMKTMKDYQDLYLKYVLLLADIFEEIGNISLKSYGLCPSHYLSYAQYHKSWVWTYVRADMCLFFEKGMRGRVPVFLRLDLRDIYIGGIKTFCP